MKKNHLHDHDDGETETTTWSSSSSPRENEFCDPNRFLTVAPVRGRVVFFYSLDEFGRADSFSEHVGCPVLSSTVEKNSATMWIQVPLP